MGKQRRERRKPHKENPTGLLSVKDFETTEDVKNLDKEKAIERVFDEVQSTNVEEKLSGLQTLEAMACDTSLAIEVSKNGIAKIIGPLLIDHNIPVRATAASTLRYIADNGGEEACMNLMKDDIMTSLSTLLKMYAEWQPKSKETEKNKIDDERETFIQVVTLLWTLCENNETVIKYSNQEDLISILMKFLDISIYGIEMSVVVAQCLLSLSEDNLSAIEKLEQSRETLINLMNLKVTADTPVSEIIPLKTLATGLLMNIIPCTESNATDVICTAISVLSDTLGTDHKKLLNNLVTLIPQGKKEFPASAKKKIQDVRKIFGAQQQAIEILANMCFEDQEIDEKSSLNSDDAEYEHEIIHDEPMDDKSIKMVSALPIELIEAIISCETIKKIWSKTAMVEANVEAALKQNAEGRSILKQIHTLRCRSYLCLNNFICNVDIDVLGGLESMYKAWLEIGMVVFQHADPTDIDLLEAATAAMRAILQKLAETRQNVFQRLTLADIEPMLNGERQCPNANVRANLIRILGNLALILVSDTDLLGQEVTKSISTFLLDVCTNETEVWVMAESLDAIMDIFAEDETDRLAADVQLVTKLQSLVSPFKHKVQQQKRNLGDNISIVSTVNTNLTRFIRYKEKRLKIHR